MFLNTENQKRPVKDCGNVADRHRSEAAGQGAKPEERGADDGDPEHKDSSQTIPEVRIHKITKKKSCTTRHCG